MNRIRQKMRSKSGATVMLALVFLLFCMFLGGSVIAAGAANGYRVSQVQQKQTQLNAQSTARVVEHQLAPEGTQLQVKITKQWPKGAEHQVTYSAEVSGGGRLTGLQRFVVETAIWRYALLNDINASQVTVSNFPDADGNPVEVKGDSFWYKYIANDKKAISGTLSISHPVSGHDPYEVAFDLDQDYDFVATIGGDNPLRVEMGGSCIIGKTTTATITVGDETSGYTDIIVERQITTVSWNLPEVEKGG